MRAEGIHDATGSAGRNPHFPACGPDGIGKRPPLGGGLSGPGQRGSGLIAASKAGGCFDSRRAIVITLNERARPALMYVKSASALAAAALSQRIAETASRGRVRRKKKPPGTGWGRPGGNQGGKKRIRGIYAKYIKSTFSVACVDLDQRTLAQPIWKNSSGPRF